MTRRSTCSSTRTTSSPSLLKTAPYTRFTRAPLRERARGLPVSIGSIFATMVGGAWLGGCSTGRLRRPPCAAALGGTARSPRCENLRDARGAPWSLAGHNARSATPLATRQLGPARRRPLSHPSPPASVCRTTRSRSVRGHCMELSRHRPATPVVKTSVVNER